MPTKDLTSEPNNSTEELVTCTKAGESLVRIRPCFSKDSKYLFVIVGSSVRVYSTNTGECTNIFYNDKGNIVSQFLNPQNHLQLMTVSKRGYICYWDYDDGVLIRELETDLVVKVCHPLNSPNCFAVVTKSNCVWQCAVQLETKTIAKKQLVDFSKKYKLFSVSNKKDFIAAAQSNVVSIHSLVTNIKKSRASDEWEISFMEWHPDDECLAVGNVLGRIELWYDYLNKVPTKTSLHWHSLPVSTICFMQSGYFFCSGGKESVLVKWHAESGMRRFLPRMGLPISHISCSPDGSLIATCHIDNSIAIVDQNYTINEVIQGLAFTHHWEEYFDRPIPTGLLFDKQSSCLVLNGRPGHLQFYSIAQDKLRFNLDIAQYNYIFEERNRKLYHLDVIKAAFDNNCEWLATVEYWNDMVNSMELRLKFWKYSPTSKNFSLITTIDAPHEKIVNSLTLQDYESINPLAVTTSDDNFFRIWSVVKDKHANEENWLCQSIGFHRNKKAGDSCFSEDGSVLCVAFETYLTLWLPHENVLQTSWCTSSPINQVKFGRGMCSSIVICNTSGSLIAFDTLSYTSLWSVDVQCSYLTSDPISEMMAVFSTDGDLFLFKPSSATPIKIYPCKQNVVAALFIGQNEQRRQDECYHSDLYFMTNDQMLHTLTNEENKFTSGSKFEKILDNRNTPVTPFGLLLAEKHKSGIKEVEEKFHEIQNVKGKKLIQMILNTPSHVLPPPSELCSSYLNLLMNDKERKLNASSKVSSNSENIIEENSKDLSDLTLKESEENESQINLTKTDSSSVEKQLKRVLKIDLSWIGEIFH